MTQETRGRKSLTGDGGATAPRTIRQTDDIWIYWQALAKAAGMKGGVRELMEDSIKRWEAEADPSVIEKAKQIVELGVL